MEWGHSSGGNVNDGEQRGAPGEASLACLLLTSCWAAGFLTGRGTVSAWVYFWAFYSVPLIYMSVFVPVPYCLLLTHKKE